MSDVHIMNIASMSCSMSSKNKC